MVAGGAVILAALPATPIEAFSIPTIGDNVERNGANYF
jgi:hypothetical protein